MSHLSLQSVSLTTMPPSSVIVGKRNYTYTENRDAYYYYYRKMSLILYCIKND